MTNTLRWVGIGMGALFGVTIVMLVRSARSASGGGSPSLDTGLTSDEARELTSDWTDEDFKTLVDITQRYKMNPADLGLVMGSESGLKASAVNRNKEGYPVAVGLIQLTSIASGAAGITEGQRVEVPTWTVAEQLPLVDRVYSNMAWTKAGNSYDHAGVLYFANAAPAHMSRGTTPDTVVYDSRPDSPTYDGSSANYDGNRGFDTAGKGYITVGDLIDHLRIVVDKPVYRAWLQRLRDVTGDSALSPSLPSS